MNPYDILGVAPTAGLDEVEAAYRTQLRAWHPDLHQVDGPAAVSEAEARTRLLNEAIARIRVGWRPGPTTGGDPPTGWPSAPPGTDWFDPPTSDERQPVPCPFCAQPFRRLDEYEHHLVDTHQMRDLLDGRRRSTERTERRRAVVRTVGMLRYVPMWLALLVTLILLWFLPFVLSPLALSFTAVVLWTQTSPLFRPPPTSARRPR